MGNLDLWDDLAANSKMHFTFLILAGFFAMNFMMVRKRRVKKSRFPSFISGFRADYSTLNPIHISYKLSRGPYHMEIHPEVPMSYVGNVKDSVKFEVDEAVKKFKSERAMQYYTRVVLTGQVNDIFEELSEEMKDKFDLLFTETKSNEVSYLYLKRKFTITSLKKLAIYLSEKCPEYEFVIPEEFKVQEQVQDQELDLNRDELPHNLNS